MNVLSSEWPRDDLHVPRFLRPPCPNGDWSHPAPTCGKEGCMPGKQPLFSQRLRVLLGCIQHHFHNTFHVSIRRSCAGKIHAEPPGNRGSHQFGIQSLPFDGARLHHIAGQSAEARLRAEPKSKTLHPAQKPPLSVADMRQQRGQLGVIPSQGWPVLAFMDIGHGISALNAANIGEVHRKANLIAALFAADTPSIRRTVYDPTEFFPLEKWTPKRTPNERESVGLGSGRFRLITWGNERVWGSNCDVKRPIPTLASFLHGQRLTTFRIPEKGRMGKRVGNCSPKFSDVSRCKKHLFHLPNCGRG